MVFFFKKKVVNPYVASYLAHHGALALETASLGGAKRLLPVWNCCLGSWDPACSPFAALALLGGVMMCSPWRMQVVSRLA